MHFHRRRGSSSSAAASSAVPSPITWPSSAGSDVVLLERKKLTSGTTWHAAGLVRAIALHGNLTRLAKYTVELYTNLEKETGAGDRLRAAAARCRIATNKERWEEFQRGAAMLPRLRRRAPSRSTPQEVQEKWPLLNVDDVIGAIYLSEGRPVPTRPTPPWRWRKARAHRRGRRSSRTPRSIGVLDQGRPRDRRRDRPGHDQRASIVVNCGGMWAQAIGAHGRRQHAAAGLPSISMS